LFFKAFLYEINVRSGSISVPNICTIGPAPTPHPRAKQARFKAFLYEIFVQPAMARFKKIRKFPKKLLQILFK
jgi:hypothetical protein